MEIKELYEAVDIISFPLLSVLNVQRRYFLIACCHHVLCGTQCPVDYRKFVGTAVLPKWAKNGFILSLHFMHFVLLKVFKLLWIFDRCSHGYNKMQS